MRQLSVCERNISALRFFSLPSPKRRLLMASHGLPIGLSVQNQSSWRRYILLLLAIATASKPISTFSHVDVIVVSSSMVIMRMRMMIGRTVQFSTLIPQPSPSFFSTYSSWLKASPSSSSILNSSSNLHYFVTLKLLSWALLSQILLIDLHI